MFKELNQNVDDWEENNDCSLQLSKLDFAINELELKYKEREEQIDLLTKSLASSSRTDRWISSVRAIFK